MTRIRRAVSIGVVLAGAALVSASCGDGAEIPAAGAPGDASIRSVALHIEGMT